MSEMAMSCVVAALICPGQAGAQPQGKQPDAKVQVTVVAVLASDRCKCVDPMLEEIAKELQIAYPKLTGFALASMTQMSIPVNGKEKFACVDGLTIEVAVRTCADANNKVRLAVKAPLHRELVYECICGKFVLMMTNLQAAERIPPMWVAMALGQAAGGGPMCGPLQASATLVEGRCRPRLILAIRAQPCNGK
jgi:hypothetical protein